MDTRIDSLCRRKEYLIVDEILAAGFEIEPPYLAPASRAGSVRVVHSSPSLYQSVDQSAQMNTITNMA